LGLDVRRKVVADEVVVPVLNNAVDECGEGAGITKLALMDGVEYVGKVSVELVLAVEMRVA
jgi:hypothetical protein